MGNLTRRGFLKSSALGASGAVGMFAAASSATSAEQSSSTPSQEKTYTLSRRIVGEYELTFDDYLARREFPDQIAVFNKSVDIHAYDCTEEEYQRYLQEYTKTGRLGLGERFGIPYGILVPRGWKNLWVAGRCNSSDVKVHGSIRVQPAASMMGQAAGTAVVQSIRTGQSADDLDTEALIKTLREAGAYLPQKSVSKEMTRA